MDRERLGRRIKAFRKLKGYTQAGLARKLNLSVTTLGDVERGKQRASNDLVDQIVLQLNITKKELINE